MTFLRTDAGKKVKETYALFMVSLRAYADPKTDCSHIDVRMLSIRVVVPNGSVAAQMPKVAAVPLVELAKFKSSIAIKAPVPHTARM